MRSPDTSSQLRLQPQTVLSRPADSVFIARHTSWGLVTLALLLGSLALGLGVMMWVELGWVAAGLAGELVWLFGLFVLPLVLRAVDAVIIDSRGISRMGPLTVRSFVPWQRVQQLDITTSRGRSALECNARLQPLPGPARRIDAFPLSDDAAASILDAANHFSRVPDSGWHGRPGAAPQNASLRLVHALPGRWWVAGVVAVIGVGSAATLWFGGRATSDDAAREFLRLMAPVVAGAALVFAAGVVWAATVCVEVGPRGIRALSGRWIRVPGVSMPWAQMIELSVASMPLVLPRRGRPVRRCVALQGACRQGSKERIFALRIPPEQAQMVADVVHVYRPDLV